MWYDCDVLYVCVCCCVLRGCAVSRRYIDVCYCDMFSVVNVNHDHLKFCVVCINSQGYVCCGECYVVSLTFLKSYLHKVDAKTHPSLLCPLCNIHTHDTHHLFNCTHIVTPGFVNRPRRSDYTAGQRSWLMDHKREHRTPTHQQGSWEWVVNKTF